MLKPDPVREKHFLFVLIPNFTMLAFATAVEPLRIANRMAGRPVYRWSLVSLDGSPRGPRTASASWWTCR
jgi:transcriptional regulator GlxA family with amidase domain